MRAPAVLLLLWLCLACTHNTEVQFSNPPPEIVNEGLDYFVDQDLVVRVERALEVEGQELKPSIPKRIRLLQTPEHWGEDGRAILVSDPEVRWRVTFWEDSNGGVTDAVDRPTEIKLWFGSGCGNCGSYRAKLTAKGKLLQGEIYFSSILSRDVDTGYRIELRLADAQSD
jgi:hypothetical protein